MLQAELNKQVKAGLAVDGIMGPKTRSSLVIVRKGTIGHLTRVLQASLYIAGFKLNPFNGIFGKVTDKAVRKFQRANQLSVDGIAGKNTWSKLFT
ncbi:peptidoglycan-binding protein [Halalkalibacter sp. APA_J-10(15)]|uniref:peptidoglycan-binding domain-containing protein n=1 Tax=Halalkalibacter sp. APA_J-10(15) TaxID=2933805 RepID=UPI001FF5FCD6|nr:peptidoglycan-binding domain-containing protein [Halalkalibacter sp. APA_J-10(15)]MCK0470272.1 peptidoglycan-binding protein [Halalkalibacter sp. APA_J-10(15)]